ncbi:uncharacterized protein BKA55DRAFT_593672 [Fusarium redolens]|uniref:Uncharacterized protein n=1 Tax=Fusarium redolens TaxID=48865 RepID=A0A9P9HCM1_FUSRE|nr:uncharacterized protein BKA55DRAFT_593672 [Fusarium redolens]KAH7254049.1 hypothetical protein BKA55DRAFT_593672 [Fusarium redolens]
MHGYFFDAPPQEESPDGSNPMDLSPQLPLRNLGAEVENIEKFFLLGLITPAPERNVLKELEVDFKERAKTGDLQALQNFIEPHLQTPDIRILHNIDFIQKELSHAPKEINDYYEFRHDSARNFIKRLRRVCRRLQDFCGKTFTMTSCEMDRLEAIMRACQHPNIAFGNGLNYLRFIGTNDQPTGLISALPALIVAYSLIHQVPGQVKELEEKFTEDLFRWKTLSALNEPDPFGLFEEAVCAAFALKSFPKATAFYVPGNEMVPPGVANRYPGDPIVVAQLQSVAFDFFLQASCGKSSMLCLC